MNASTRSVRTLITSEVFDFVMNGPDMLHQMVFFTGGIFTGVALVCFYERAALALRSSLGGFSPPPGKILEIVADRGQRDMGT